MLITLLEKDFSEIHEYVTGIIFLGVPFQGSEVAKAGELFAGITLKERGYRKMISSLKRDENGLFNSLRQFASSYNNLNMVCFTERKDTKFGLFKKQVYLIIH